MPGVGLMRLDFNETNILVQVLTVLEKNPKVIINKIKLSETLYALFAHTDKKYAILRMSIKSLMAKLEKLSDDDILRILEDSKNEKIINSVCYELPAASDRPQHRGNGADESLRW